MQIYKKGNEKEDYYSFSFPILEYICVHKYCMS